jgi:hypothetical protein
MMMLHMSWVAVIAYVMSATLDVGIEKGAYIDRPHNVRYL